MPFPSSGNHMVCCLFLLKAIRRVTFILPESLVSICFRNIRGMIQRFLQRWPGLMGRNFFFFKFIFIFMLFGGYTCGIWKFPGQESNWSCSCQPTPQPQQRGIQTTSAAYTAAHGNTGSLTHRARSGIEPASPWVLAGFVNH